MHLTAAHWVYLAGMVVIIATMLLRKNIVVPAVLATFATALAYTRSVIGGLTSIFSASLAAAQELFNIFLIIALVTAMLHALESIGAAGKMIAPFRKIMRNGHMAFWTLAVIAYLISLFFWPTPAVPLIGAILIPVAIRAGMRPMAVGMTVVIAGQGMALSSDYVIRVAPGLSAKAAGVNADAVASKAMLLSLVVGGIALVIAYAMEIRKMRKPSPTLLAEWEASAQREAVTTDAETITETNEGTGTTERQTAAATLEEGERELVLTGVSSHGIDGGTPTSDARPSDDDTDSSGPSGGVSDATTADFRAADDAAALHPKSSSFFALFVPLAYLALIAYMILASTVSAVPSLSGDDAAALVGGVAALMVFLVALVCDGGKASLESSATHVVDGLVFAFKAMGVVIPIAGFFFLGSDDFAGNILGTTADKTPALLFDLVTAAQQHLPNNAVITTFGILIIGMIAGLDGSGFSGIPLTGALAGSLGGAAAGVSATSLAAIGQMGNIWSGGGTLVAWSSLIAIAAFARVPVIELARKCFLPVGCGLAAAALVTALFLG